MIGGNRERERSTILKEGTREHERAARNRSDGKMTHESDGQGWKAGEKEGCEVGGRRSRERYEHKENEKREEARGWWKGETE